MPSSAAPPAQARPAGDGPSWPCAACGSSVPLSDPLCGTCGRPFLAEADPREGLVLPGVGDLSALDRARRLLVGVVAALALALLVGLLGAVVDLLT